MIHPDLDAAAQRLHAALDEMTALERAKYVIEARIRELAKLLQLPARENFAAPKHLKPLPVGDPTVLGRDVLGRIKRKRTLTPEQREAKRVQLAKVRQERYKKFAESKAKEIRDE